MIEAEPFPKKLKKNPVQDSNYHLDADDLNKINEVEKSIYPYSSNIDMTKNEYIKYMKQEWIKIISTNRMLPILEYLNDQLYESYEVVWSGTTRKQ